MSLLDHGRDQITVYPEIQFTDSDGNVMTGPDENNPITTQATLQPAAQSGTSARRAEQDNEGFETESNYRMRLPRDFPFILGAQSRIEWNGEYWAVIGDARKYNGSPRTAHVDYQIRKT